MGRAGSLLVEILPPRAVKGEPVGCVLPTFALCCPDLADWLPARGGRYPSGGGLLPGQLAGVCDQQGSCDMHEESGEGQPGPGEHLRDDGGEARP